MATTPFANVRLRDAEMAERRFFFVLILIMSVLMVAGFALNLALGRSTFAVPFIFHAHAVVFFGWMALFIAQSGLIASNNTALHRTLGSIAVMMVPIMVVLGCWLMVVVMHRTGGPFFFDQNEFLFSNPAHLLCFAGLTFAALKVRRHAGWHRRLMLVGYAILSGPGLGRLVPLPLVIPHGWRIMVLVILIWPAIGMIRDKMKHGRVHPAWYWGVGSFLAIQIIADIVAYSSLGVSLTEQFLAGTPGGQRPMGAFLPPGMAI